VVLMMVVVVVVALLPLVYEYLQPKEIKEIKEFLLTARRKDARCTYHRLIWCCVAGKSSSLA